MKSHKPCSRRRESADLPSANSRSRLRAILGTLALLFILALALPCPAAQSITNVNTGASANDRTGDPLRTAFQKLNTNDNFLAVQLLSLAGLSSNNVFSGSNTFSGPVFLVVPVAWLGSNQTFTASNVFSGGFWAPGLGWLATNQTWTGSNTFIGGFYAPDLAVSNVYVTNLIGSLENMSNAVDLVPGPYVTITTNSNGRTFTIGSSNWFQPYWDAVTGRSNLFLTVSNDLVLRGDGYATADSGVGGGSAWLRFFTNNANLGLWCDGLSIGLFAGYNRYGTTTPAMMFGSSDGAKNQSMLPLDVSADLWVGGHGTIISNLTIGGEIIGGGGAGLSNVVFNGRAPFSMGGRNVYQVKVWLTNNAALPTTIPLETWWNTNTVILTSYESHVDSTYLHAHTWEVRALRDFTTNGASFILRAENYNGSAGPGAITWMLSWKP